MFKESIVEYPDRGAWGSSAWRGNTTGHIVNDFLDYVEMKTKQKVKSCSDYMVGGGTTRDVCQERGIPGVFTDLHMGFNLLTDDIPDRPQTIFNHAPYSTMIPYAGNMYSSEEVHQKYGFDPEEYDLGKMPWEKFISAYNYILMKCFSALETGGYMGILNGDRRKNGHYYSMFREMVLPGELESVIIKKQCNTLSERKEYTSSSFVPIRQEYFTIIRKKNPYILDFSLPKSFSLDIRNSKDATWFHVICSVFEKRHDSVLSLSIIYSEIEGHRKTENNPHWKDKIRQVLQEKDIFIHVSRGVWKMEKF